MKKIILLFVCILTMASCEQEGLTQEVSIEETGQNLDAYAKKNSNATKQGKKVAVCHTNGKIISVNENALSEHIAHGDAVDMDGDGFFDKENSCSQGMDCDDTKADVNPDAEEIYTDEIDNNCNGVIGKMQVSSEFGACSECALDQSGNPTFGTYKHISNGKCKEFDVPPTGNKANLWKRCTEEVVTYVD